jgi:hypothetical protein
MFRDQSSLEIAKGIPKGKPEENNRLVVSRSQSEEVEMPNEITNPSRRTFQLAPSRSCACGSRDGTASRTHRRNPGARCIMGSHKKFVQRKRIAPYT